MIAIDSMLWVYNCDVNAPEHGNVHRWLEGDGQRRGVIETDDLLINTVIAMEVVHSLRRVAVLPTDVVYDYVGRMITLRNMQVEPFDPELLREAMGVLEDYFAFGIGGRDATIIATMRKHGGTSIATHDRDLLSIPDFERIDPTSDPPLRLARGEHFARRRLQARSVPGDRAS